MNLKAWIAGAFALAVVCAAPAARAERAGCVHFQAPAGWVRGEPSPDATVVLRSPKEAPFGKARAYDMIQVREIPAPGLTLWQYRDRLKAAPREAVNEELRERSEDRAKVEAAPPKIKETTIAGIRVLLIEAETKLEMDGVKIATRNHSLVTVGNGTLYLIQGGYTLAREKEVRPVLERFFSTVRFDCSK